MEHNITGRRLMFLSTDDLFAIGVKSLGHRKDLQEEIQELRLENYRLQHFPPLSVVRTRGDGCIGHMSYEGFVNGKKPNIKQEFEHCFCQYRKNNISDIRLIPRDHITDY